MNTYQLLGVFTGSIIFSVAVVLPFAAYLIYIGRAFINDDTNNTHDDASKKALAIIKLPDLGMDGLGGRFLAYFTPSLLALFMWPLMILAAAVYMFMLFLRLTKRLQKHTSDKDAHK